LPLCTTYSSIAFWCTAMPLYYALLHPSQPPIPCFPNAKPGTICNQRPGTSFTSLRPWHPELYLEVTLSDLTLCSKTPFFFFSSSTLPLFSLAEFPFLFPTAPTPPRLSRLSVTNSNSSQPLAPLVFPPFLLLPSAIHHRHRAAPARLVDKN